MSDLLERLRAALADRYAVESEIGRGGMATVFLAEDLKHGRKVAIKVLYPELAASVGGERFLREIEIAAGLDHPHILKLLDSGTADGLFYYVMPYVDGESLRERLEREQQLPIEEAVRLASEVADGLGHAHRQGVIHRDIKPANIMLSEGHALIADFGIAKAVGTDGTALTRTGLAVGTPQYMSPEQASGVEVDARSDVYALGCVIYEMLAGEPPLTGANPQAIAARRLIETATSLSVLRDTVPGGLDTVVSKALARSRVDRYETGGELVEALASPDLWKEAKPGRHVGRGVLYGVIGAVLLGAGALLAQMFLGAGPTVELSERRIAVLPLVPAAGSDTALGNLGHAVATRISANLGGIGDIETVPYQTIRSDEGAAGGSLEAAAHWARNEAGAGRVAHGTLVRTGDEVSFEVNLLSSELGAVAQASFAGRGDDYRLLADSISWQILGQLWSAGEAPIEYYEHLIGRAFAPVRDFLTAEAFYTRGWEREKAVRAFARAFLADTTLWAASIMYDFLLDEYDPPETLTVDSAVREAYRPHIEDAPTPYREFAEARMEGRSMEEQLQRFEQILSTHPRFWPVVMEYADNLAFGGYRYGYAAADVIQAHVDCVDVQPHLLGCWIKLLIFSAGKDAVALQRARDYLEARSLPEPWGSSLPDQFTRLYLAYERGDPSAALLDSVARDRDWYPAGGSNPSLMTWLGGAPQIFHDLHRRRLESETDAEIPPARLYWDAYAWAMRGGWDSSLVALDRYTRESSDDRTPLLAFNLTATGEWLGDLPAATSRRYLDGAIAFAAAMEDKARRADHQAMIHSMSGILAASRGDESALREADRQLATIEGRMARRAQRVLAAYTLYLDGSVRKAGDSLYGASWGTPSMWGAINRINASRWLLATGDTVRATSLLKGCQWSGLFAASFQVDLLLAGHCYLALARIEEALGRDGLARGYYRQFLKRYDSPVGALRPTVEEARGAYERVGGDRARLPPLRFP